YGLIGLSLILARVGYERVGGSNCLEGWTSNCSESWASNFSEELNFINALLFLLWNNNHTCLKTLKYGKTSATVYLSNSGCSKQFDK
ncbi:11410_t:CDS:2, partial [Scutellospora calospora]